MSSSRIHYVQEAKSLDRNIALSRLTLIVMIDILYILCVCMFIYKKVDNVRTCIRVYAGSMIAYLSFFSLRTARSEPHDRISVASEYLFAYRLRSDPIRSDPQMLFAGGKRYQQGSPLRWVHRDMIWSTRSISRSHLDEVKKRQIEVLKEWVCCPCQFGYSPSPVCSA
jgi:hypothetical protein